MNFRHINMDSSRGVDRDPAVEKRVTESTYRLAAESCGPAQSVADLSTSVAALARACKA